MLVCCLVTAYCMARITCRNDRLLWRNASRHQRRSTLYTFC